MNDTGTGAAPRLLIIGNSHIAAPRLAYLEDPDRWPGWDVDFCGLPGGSIGHLDLREGVLHPADRKVAGEMRQFNLVRSLDVSGYDAFAIIGGFGWAGVAALCADHRSPDFPSVVAGTGGGDSCQLVGHAMLVAALRARCRNSASARLLRQLADLGRPVVMLPEPMPSAECGSDPARFGAYVDLVARGDADLWRQMFQRAAEEELASGAVLPFWPAAASEDGLHTRPDLMRGSVRLSAHRADQHGEGDYAHGNAQYGALVMDQVMVALPLPD